MELVLQAAQSAGDGVIGDRDGELHVACAHGRDEGGLRGPQPVVAAFDGEPGADDLVRPALRPQRLDRAGQNGVAAGSVQLPQQHFVLVQRIAHPAPLDCDVHPLAGQAHDLQVCLGGPDGTLACRLDLQDLAHLVDVQQLGDGELTDPGALVRRRCHQAVLLEPAQRIADRHHTGADHARDVAHAEPAPTGQLAGEDGVRQDAEHLVGDQSRLVPPVLDGHQSPATDRRKRRRFAGFSAIRRVR